MIGEEQGEDEINEHEHGNEVAREKEEGDNAHQKEQDWHVVESPEKQIINEGGDEKREE